MSELDVLLKYTREGKCWRCPECDLEMVDFVSQCPVCGFRKTPRVTMINRYNDGTPLDETAKQKLRGMQPAPAKTPPVAEPPTTPTSYAPPTHSGATSAKPGKSSVSVGWIIFWIIVILGWVVVLATIATAVEIPLHCVATNLQPMQQSLLTTAQIPPAVPLLLCSI